MKRREFITSFGGMAFAWPLAARTQQPEVPVIGWLSFTAPDKEPQVQAAFRQGLRESGFVEGKNVGIEHRWVESRYDLIPSVLTDLIRRRVAVMVVSTDPAAVAAKAMATGVPIVFTIGGDPVQMGLVATLNRPGGNLTGVTGLNAALLPKKLELLREMVPATATFAGLVNPLNPNAETLSNEMRSAARSLGLQLHIVHAGNDGDFNTVFASLAQLRYGGLVIGGDPFFISRNELLAAFALRYAMPTISHFREFATAGGLLSYGGRLVELQRQAGVYAGRIMKGEKPADLPVQQSAKAELFVNIKTAKALGITIPPTLLARADEVIE